MSGSFTGHPVLDPRLAPPFPTAALPVLRNPQLRKNVAHATDVIQAKRARLVAEKTDWEELRSAAAAIRKSCSRKPGQLSRRVRGSLHRCRRHGPLGFRRRRGARDHS